MPQTILILDDRERELERLEVCLRKALSANEAGDYSIVKIWLTQAPKQDRNTSKIISELDGLEALLLRMEAHSQKLLLADWELGNGITGNTIARFINNLKQNRPREVGPLTLINYSGRHLKMEEIGALLSANSRGVIYTGSSDEEITLLFIQLLEKWKKLTQPTFFFFDQNTISTLGLYIKQSFTPAFSNPNDPQPLALEEEEKELLQLLGNGYPFQRIGEKLFKEIKQPSKKVERQVYELYDKMGISQKESHDPKIRLNKSIRLVIVALQLGLIHLDDFDITIKR